MLLSVRNLQVSYGRIKALHGIDFEIAEGEIVTIIGANGAGKSTTLRAISRMMYGCSTVAKASIFSEDPVTSRTMESMPTSSTRARNTSAT